MRYIYFLVFFFIGIAAEDCIAQPMSNLKAVGSAKLRVLFFDVYTSELKTESGNYFDGIRPIQLRINYERDIKSRALIKQTKKEWDAQMVSVRNQRSWINKLEKIWPDVKSGDSLIFELYKNEKNQFFYNGKTIGNIEDPIFGETFLDIWLSIKTTRPNIRQAMLGRK